MCRPMQAGVGREVGAQTCTGWLAAQSRGNARAGDKVRRKKKRGRQNSLQMRRRAGRVGCRAGSIPLDLVGLGGGRWMGGGTAAGDCLGLSRRRLTSSATLRLALRMACKVLLGVGRGIARWVGRHKDPALAVRR